MKHFIFIFFSLFLATSFSQTDKKKAYKMGMEAIIEMDNGNYKKAIKILNKCQKLDPDNIDYPYETSLAYYQLGKYKKSIKILEKLKNRDDTTPLVYQMLGNSYDMNEQAEKAIEVYNKGLNLFPSSGPLYLERGTMELKKENFNEALSFYEKGIEVNPEFSSNYYWAARLYLNSKQEVWGLIYGELFMNLERNTRRTVEMSKLLYDTYNREIEFISDSSMRVSFCSQMTLTLDDLEDTANFKLPFCLIFEPTFLMGVPIVKEVNLNSLNKIRTNFIKNYYEQEHNQDYPNVLFDYQKELMEIGHLEAYNHWILMKGDEETFKKWHTNNEKKWNAFLDWFTDHQLTLNKTHRFYRNQY